MKVARFFRALSSGSSSSFATLNACIADACQFLLLETFQQSEQHPPVLDRIDPLAAIASQVPHRCGGLK